MKCPSYSAPIYKSQIAELVKPSERPLILEIGANDGTDSFEMFEAIPTIELHAFECDPRPLARFEKAMFEFASGRTNVIFAKQEADYIPFPRTRLRVDDRSISIYPHAIGNHDGTIAFHQSGGTTQGAHLKDWDLSGSIRKPTGHLQMSPWCTFDKTIEVPIRKLDTWAAENIAGRVVDFAWVDVQGSHEDVILGGRETLNRTRFWMCEFYPTPMYEGEIGIEKQLELLGPNWELMATFEGYNYLARNRAML